MNNFAAVSKHVEIKTELYDGGQNPITSQNIRLAVNDSSNKSKSDILTVRTATNYCRALVVVSPALKLRDSDDDSIFINMIGYNPATQKASFVLANDELKAVKSIRTSAQNGELATE